MILKIVHSSSFKFLISVILLVYLFITASKKNWEKDLSCLFIVICSIDCFDRITGLLVYSILFCLLGTFSLRNDCKKKLPTLDSGINIAPEITVVPLLKYA